MKGRVKGRYPEPWGMFALSFGIHLAVFLFIARVQLLPALHPDETVTYVDMVSLPVASPQSGMPAPPAQAAPKPAAAPAPATPPAAMALPAAKPKAKVAAPSATKQQAEKPAAEPDDREFRERMAKLERQAEEKRQAAVIDSLRKNKTGRTGMPTGKGSEAGVDYTSYIQSRVQDAMEMAGAPQSKSPLVIVAITIGPDGRVMNYHVEKNSGDPLFDDAVARAVALASKSWKPPPGGVPFERKFRFRQKGSGGVR